MECLELPIPPLPQLITAGHTVWKPGRQHFTRSFSVYDVLLVKRGAVYITEEHTAYEVKGGHILVLEPNVLHWGHAPCTEDTEIYWIHFTHPSPQRRLSSNQVPWSFLYRRGTDIDYVPVAQHMYLPKFGPLRQTMLWPILDQIVELHRGSTMKNALLVQALLANLFVELQSIVYAESTTRSNELVSRVEAYLHERYMEPYDAQDMKHALHYEADYLSRCLKKHTGMSALQYLNHIRIHKVKMLLETTPLALQEIAAQTGFADSNYMIRQFRKKTGLTPQQYRQSRNRR
ncbi:helix-turn-helix domain-containing protein [Paenibacillus flagellatus]|uniref:AraC family transcriptional regulator n=1 Tax=Paenibacillus flagellatus TaxID=2211139 RepID=A0A2V5K213_9BACL|nr:helix-turn-helix domain-containing protein [Paenibacillus flagellatus]PYI51563.1 AraC family transcriptional regulator [Paenibacillus flagellatus]